MEGVAAVPTRLKDGLYTNEHHIHLLPPTTLASCSTYTLRTRFSSISASCAWVVGKSLRGGNFVWEMSKSPFFPYKLGLIFSRKWVENADLVVFRMMLDGLGQVGGLLPDGM